MEARSIRKLETRHVNLKPTERSEGGFKFTCRVSNFRIDRYRHSLTDLYTGITNSDAVFRQHLARLLTETSVSLGRSYPMVSAFSVNMTFDQIILCAKREN